VLLRLARLLQPLSRLMPVPAVEQFAIAVLAPALVQPEPQ
jgi:hypothetical protein